MGFLWSCSSEETVPNHESSEDVVIFNANVIESSNSRVTIEDEIRERKLNLTFHNQSDYEIGFTDFDSKGWGTSKRFTEGTFTDLEWNYLLAEDAEERYSFCLDNLSEEFETKTTEITFPDDNPYRASVLVPWNYEEANSSQYEELSCNDLIWGKVLNKKASSLTVNLNHVMASFRLRIYFDNTVGFDELIPEKVSISNIFQTTTSFNRLTGNFGLKDAPEEEDFTLVETFDTKFWDIVEDPVTQILYYESPVFVVPPQDFIQNNRPRLNVTLTNGGFYTGLFPRVMSIKNENGNWEDALTSFMKSYTLVMTVKISNQPSSMQFMPVTMLEWNNKGTYNFTGTQASIIDVDDLKNLISAYSKGDTSYFDHWGYYEKGIWYFNIYRTLELDTSYAGKLKENLQIPYEFDMHYGVVTIKISENNVIYLTASNKGAEKLKKFLNEGTIPSDD